MAESGHAAMFFFCALSPTRCGGVASPHVFFVVEGGHVITPVAEAERGNTQARTLKRWRRIRAKLPTAVAVSVQPLSHCTYGRLDSGGVCVHVRMPASVLVGMGDMKNGMSMDRCPCSVSSACVKQGAHTHTEKERRKETTAPTRQSSSCTKNTFLPQPSSTERGVDDED